MICENLQILRPIPIITKYPLPFISPHNDVIQTPHKLSTRARFDNTSSATEER